jgi:hypothetical protein
MKISRLEDYKGGWFIGNFEPTAYKTDLFEVCYKFHKSGEKWDVHFHKEATEINLLIEGEMIIQNKVLKSGDIFILETWEIADPIFKTDCTVLVVKTPSKTNDKYTIKL